MPQTEHDFHRTIAAECFNRTWDHLEQENRGTLQPVTGQISRVYVALNQPDLALRFAKTGLKYSRKIISQSASFALTKAWQEPMPWEEISERDQLHAVTLDVEDRKTYSDQIDETERMIQK